MPVEIGDREVEVVQRRLVVEIVEVEVDGVVVPQPQEPERNAEADQPLVVGLSRHDVQRSGLRVRAGRAPIDGPRMAGQAQQRRLSPESRPGFIETPIGRGCGGVVGIDVLEKHVDANIADRQHAHPEKRHDADRHADPGLHGHCRF